MIDKCTCRALASEYCERDGFWCQICRWWSTFNQTICRTWRCWCQWHTIGNISTRLVQHILPEILIGDATRYTFRWFHVGTHSSRDVVLKEQILQIQSNPLMVCVFDLPSFFKLSTLIYNLTFGEDRRNRSINSAEVSWSIRIAMLLLVSLLS